MTVGEWTDGSPRAGGFLTFDGNEFEGEPRPAPTATASVSRMEAAIIH